MCACLYGWSKPQSCPPVNIPFNPTTKIGSKNGWCTYSKMVSSALNRGHIFFDSQETKNGFLPHPRIFESGNPCSFAGKVARRFRVATWYLRKGNHWKPNLVSPLGWSDGNSAGSPVSAWLQQRNAGGGDGGGALTVKR